MATERVLASGQVYHLEADRVSGLYHVVEEDAPFTVSEILSGYLDEIPTCEECMGEANPYVVFDGGEVLCFGCASRGMWECPKCGKEWEADLSGYISDVIFDDPNKGIWSMPAGTLDKLAHCPACTSSVATGQAPPWKFHVMEG